MQTAFRRAGYPVVCPLGHNFILLVTYEESQGDLPAQWEDQPQMTPPSSLLPAQRIPFRYGHIEPFPGPWDHAVSAMQPSTQAKGAAGGDSVPSSSTQVTPQSLNEVLKNTAHRPIRRRNSRIRPAPLATASGYPEHARNLLDGETTFTEEEEEEESNGGFTKRFFLKVMKRLAQR